MKIRSEHNPNSELIKEALPTVDFTDTFSTQNRVNSLEEITHLIFGKSPKWVEYLLRFRNFLVRFVGLKVVKPEDMKSGFEPEGHVSFFKIYAIKPEEILLGADDSHLNFRVSVLLTDDLFNVKVTTLVEYQNWFGKFYMFFVKPFHRIIVRRMVKQAYHQE